MTDSLFTRPAHIGFIVRDIHEAVKHFESLGIGPFTTFHFPKKMVKRHVYGAPPSGELKVEVRYAPLGPIMLQLVSPLEGDFQKMRYLKRNGEGVDHIAFYVDDLDATKKAMAEKGYTEDDIISEGRAADGGGWMYFDTSKTGDVIVEFLCYTEDFPKIVLEE
jgi:4-hydroxyphenylpyruvate dioxygenase-like putative hemolysin